MRSLEEIGAEYATLRARLAEVEAERDQAIRQAAGSQSLRQIAKQAGVSHQRVDQIIKENQ